MRRTAAVIAALFLLVPIVPLVGSAAQTSNSGGAVVREVVSTTLEADGSTASTRVAQLVRLSGDSRRPESVRVPARAIEDYRNLTGFSAPEVEGANYVLRSTDRLDSVAVIDTKEQDLPVDIAVSYTLDGKETKAADLKGRSGVVRVEIDLENTTRDTKTVTFTNAAGEEESRTTLVYLPLEYSIRFALPMDRWTDLKADGGIVQTDENGTQHVSIPGLLNPPVGPVRDTVAFEASSQDVLLPEIRIVAVPRTSELARDAFDVQAGTLTGLVGSFESAGSTISAVYDGTLAIASGLEAILAGVGARDPSTGEPIVTIGDNGLPTTVVGGIGFLRNSVRDQLIPAIGARDPATGKPVVTLGANGQPTTVIGGIGFLSNAVSTQLLPAVGRIDPATKRATTGASTILGSLQLSKDTYDNALIPAVQTQFLPALDGLRQLGEAGVAAATAVGDLTGAGIFGQMLAVIAPLTAGMSNPAYTSPQPEIGGEVPLNYQLRCSACFDPKSPNFDKRMADPADPSKLAPKFRPALLETFKLFSALTQFGMQAINTNDPANPGLVEGLQLVVGGLDALAVSLNTGDPSKPGLVEGLKLVQDGSTALVNIIHTLDPANPGVVEGIQQVIDGTKQASTGLFAVNQLVLGTAAAGTSQAAGNAAIDAAVVRQQAKDVEGHSFLASSADSVDTTYVFTLAGQSTTARDNAVRAGLGGIAAIAAVALGRRSRVV